MKNFFFTISFLGLASCAPGHGFFTDSPANLNNSAAGVGPSTPVTAPSGTTASSGSTGSPGTTASTGTAGSTGTATLPPRPSSAANQKVCPGATPAQGLDVSDYDTGTTWPKVAAAGKSFTFIKATEGLSLVNSQFATDWPAAKANGVARGAYHFFHPGDDPTQQAQFFLNTVGTVASNDLPLMLDWETSDGVSSATQIANAKIFLNLIEAATGKIPVIYVDTSYWNELGNPQGFDRYPLFIAEYGVSCPSIPPPWNTWTFWQQSDTGTVNGVSTAQVDMDLFNGIVPQLTQFATTGTY